MPPKRAMLTAPRFHGVPPGTGDIRERPLPAHSRRTIRSTGGSVLSSASDQDPASLERAAELEAPRIGGQIGDRKVAANVEAIGGCQALTERRQVRLGVARVLAQRAQHAQVSEARM